MKILLIGNYKRDQQFSMQKFTDCLAQNLINQGYEIRICQPLAFFGQGFSSTVSGIGKWLGYLDKYLLFPLSLKKQASWADVIHICDHSNAIYVPYIKKYPHLVTCHDLMAVRSALGGFEEYNQVGSSGKIQQRWILNSLKKAGCIAAVSNATKNDILRLTNQPTDHVDVIYNGLNYPFHRLEKDQALTLLKNTGIDTSSHFLLHVGGNQWYKNRKGLLAIFNHFNQLDPNSNLKLVMAGKLLTEEHKQLIHQYELSDKVLPVSDLSTEQICALYSLCKAFVFPSLCEGFGWPVIEAQACQALVFTSNRAPMTEIGGSAAIYIDPENPEKAANTILETLKQETLIAKTKLTIPDNLQKFSTEQMVLSYLALYKKLTTKKAEQA